MRYYYLEPCICPWNSSFQALGRPADFKGLKNCAGFVRVWTSLPKFRRDNPDAEPIVVEHIPIEKEGR